MLQFFITRPKFAMVISLVITLIGLAAFKVLPVEHFPEITPPTINVRAEYPGASALDVVQSIAATIEAEVNGVDGMLYMESSSSNSGSYNLDITFAKGIDPDMAAVEVQNRVSRVTSRLPAEAIDQGIAVRTRSNNILLGVGIYSPEQTQSHLLLSNYANINIKETLARIPGVGDIQSFGGHSYNMRVWLSPDKMDALNITALEVIQALQEQNALAAIGQIGSPPSAPTQGRTLTITAEGRLKTPEEFSAIILRSDANGAMVRLGDVADVELGSENYRLSAVLNEAPVVFLAIYPTPGANAIDLSSAIKAEMSRMSESFPADMTYSINFDSSDFVRASMSEASFSLFLTLMAVLIVVYLFLQNFRAIFIVSLIIPVSLIGTCMVLYAFGYSANTLTIFGIILALTMVVDDAIVVVENVERKLEENPEYTSAQATAFAMKEIAGPIIATTLVLLAVFVPVAALPGIVGTMFRQFAITIAAAMCFSSLCALTLSPALCVVLLKRRESLPVGVFRAFNGFMDKARDGYVAISRTISNYKILAIAGVAGAVFVAWMALLALPTGFLPDEDQGFFFLNVQLPDGVALGHTERVTAQARAIITAQEGVQAVICISGFSLLNGTVDTNSAFGIVILKPWGERPPLPQIMQRLQPELNTIPSASIMAINPPPIPGLGSASGLDLRIQAIAGQSVQEMTAVSRSIIFAANQHPKLAQVFSTYSATVPQISLEVDRDRAALLGVPVNRIFSTLQTAFGGASVSDFNRSNRVFRVTLQNAMQYRTRTDQIYQLKVRNNTGDLVRMDALVKTTAIVGAPFIQQFNMFPAVSIMGSPAPGYSSGQAMEAMEEVLHAHLPEGYSHAWAGMSFQEQQTGNTAMFLYLAAFVFAYLFLVAQYESWTVPLTVLLSVLFAVGGALACLAATGFTNDLYVQIGIILIIGIAAKNAILIVEFSRIRRMEGASIAEAAMDGARTRFRAVMMTAVSFLFGVLPLMLATGAGSISRQTIGSTVFYGMLVATGIGLFFIPALYRLLQGMGETFSKKNPLPAPVGNEKE